MGPRKFHPGKPEWGAGHVLSEDSQGRATIFFVRGGRRRIDTRLVRLESLHGEPALNSILDVVERTDWSRASHNVYVVELSIEIFHKERRFAAENPHYSPGARPCVYVGMTGLSPAERLKSHRDGVHSAKFVKRYGMGLIPELYDHFNPMPHDVAKAMELELARQLRERGYGVWQK